MTVNMVALNGATCEKPCVRLVVVGSLFQRKVPTTIEKQQQNHNKQPSPLTQRLLLNNPPPPVTRIRQHQQQRPQQATMISQCPEQLTGKRPLVPSAGSAARQKATKSSATSSPSSSASKTTNSNLTSTAATTAATATYVSKQPEQPPAAGPSPVKYLQNLFSKCEPGRRIIKRPRSTTWDKPTQEAMDAYDVQVVQAIREKNIDTLRNMLKAGKSLDACNRFGESILAMACRRGDVETVQFLVSEAKVKVSVRDDFGRLPHHDCCWTPVPNFRVMDVLLKVSPPELLISQDVRGHTPFHYARQEHWDDWLHFLEERSDKLLKALNEHTTNNTSTTATAATTSSSSSS